MLCCHSSLAIEPRRRYTVPMSRFLARLMIVIATLGLVASPASACASKATPAMAMAPVAASTAARDCHDEQVPAETGDRKQDNCCQSMCASALLPDEHVMQASSLASIVTQFDVSVLVTVGPLTTKPPPRTDA